MCLFPRGLTALLAALVTLHADEGLWLYNEFPKEAVKKKYGFEVSDQFLDKLRLSSVRFNSGGSGSFVSSNGLILTNHHVGSDCLQKLSSKDHDYRKNGFSAEQLADEKPCPDLEINVLLKIEEITDKVTSGIPKDSGSAEANRRRKARMAKIEKDCASETGNRCDVVPLFSGGRYDLYQYKKYTDVRLVFAPEFAIAFFGGDQDNFEYPRYCLDIAFFRAYENGKPVESKNYLPFSKAGAKEGELTFVSGHPGTTQRLATVANLEFVRDVQLPTSLRRYEHMIAALTEYGKRGSEQARQRNDLFFYAQNSYKASYGFLKGLRNPQLMEKKREAEAKLKDAVMSDPTRRAAYGKVWDEVAGAFQDARSYYKFYCNYEMVPASGSELMYFARVLTRMAEEDKKPNGDRLKEYNDAMRPELEQWLFSTAPIYPELETAVLAANLHFMKQELGAKDPVITELLDGKTPEEAAAAAVQSTKLADVDLRKKLAKEPGALATIQEDGVLRMIRKLDGPAREYRKKWEDGVQAELAVSAGKIARARYEIYGISEYPDATFTLRLTYGPAKGYVSAAGKKVFWATDLGGTYRHATGKEPLALPRSWISAKTRLSKKVPFNFVSSTDIHGGNSGSPTVNTKGELIGVVFDGNIESLPNKFQYDETRARSVHVASQGIVEALRNIYRANRVLQELGL